MTAAELRALIAAGGLSHSEAARRIGINPRHMRKLLAGEVAISAGVEADILQLFGAAPDGDAFPRDEWILGEGPPPARREYIMHTTPPRFIARVVGLDVRTDAPERREEPVSQAGVAYQADDSLICEIRWLDAPPADDDALRQLLDQAADQLE